MTSGGAQPLRTLGLGAAAVALGFALGMFARDLAADARGSAGSDVALDAEAMRVAMADALREPRTLERARALDALLLRMGEGNVAGVEAAFDAIIVGVRDCDVEAYLHARSVFDPRGAFDHALRWPSLHKRGLGAKAVAYSWSLRGGALEVQRITESLTAESVREASVVGMVTGWARSEDTAGVTTFLMRLPDATMRNNVLLSFLTGALLSRRGSDALFEWFEGIPEDAPNGFKGAAFQNALLQAGFVDPLGARALWELHLAEPWADDSLWRLAVGWQRLEPEVALDWLVELGPRYGRNEALKRALQRWASRDGPAAQRWLARTDLSGEPGLQRALRRVARQRGETLPWDES